MKKQILYMLCATALLSSCHIYKSYDRPEDITASGLYRDPAADNDTLASDTTNIGNQTRREVQALRHISEPTRRIYKSYAVIF